MDGLEGIALGVALDEGDVVDPGGLGVLAAELEKPLAAIDGQHRARRADPPGEHDRRVAEAAADVQHAAALGDFQ